MMTTAKFPDREDRSADNAIMTVRGFDSPFTGILTGTELKASENLSGHLVHLRMDYFFSKTTKIYRWARQVQLSWSIPPAERVECPVNQSPGFHGSVMLTSVIGLAQNSIHKGKRRRRENRRPFSSASRQKSLHHPRQNRTIRTECGIHVARKRASTGPRPDLATF